MVDHTAHHTERGPPPRAIGVDKYSMIPRPIPEEQASFERNAIFVMIKSLESVKDAGYSDWQTLTSFLANLLLDQDNPNKMLKRLHDDVKLKVRLMQQQKRLQ
jgi:hypothetical protein